MRFSFRLLFCKCGLRSLLALPILISYVRLTSFEILSSTLADRAILQKDINTLYNWSQTWQMCFNAKKCHIHNISWKRQKPCLHYQLGQEALTVVDSYPYLGVTISSDLRWHNISIIYLQRQPGLSILFALTSTLVHLKLKHLPITPCRDGTGSATLTRDPTRDASDP